MIPKIRIFTATQKADIADTDIFKSIHNLPVNMTWSVQNKTPLTKLYNEQISQARVDGIEYLICVHDDVHINCEDFLQRIDNYGSKYAVFGLAGTTSVTIKEPVLWHLMTDRKNLRGCVAHGNKNEYTYTSFGSLPSKVVMIDGVFICINIAKLPENVTFDEKCPAAFHFYDLMFSLDCSLNKVPVGVGDVPIIHQSPGLRDMNKEWKQGQKYFLNKYEKYLNKTLTV